jgi:uncharacterized membrane protein YhaH (DUF805 family)
MIRLTHLSDAYLSFEGRIARGRWRLAAAGLVAGLVLVYAATHALESSGLLGPDGRDRVRVFVQVALLGPWLALDWKRFHDLGRPGSLALACPGLFLLSLVWDRPAVAALAPAHGSLTVALSWAQGALALALVVILPFVGGTRGENRYGPEPS